MPKYFPFNPPFLPNTDTSVTSVPCEQMLMGQPVKWYDPLSSILFFSWWSWLVHYWSGPVPNDHFREVEWQICLSSCTMWFIKDPRKCSIETGSWLNQPKVNKLSFQNLCWPADSERLVDNNNSCCEKYLNFTLRVLSTSVCLRFICHIIPLLSVCLCLFREASIACHFHSLIDKGGEEEGGRGAKVKDFLKTSSAPLYNLDKLFSIWSGAPTKIKLKQAYVKINRCKAFKVQALSSKTFKWEEKQKVHFKWKTF